ncbi:MAG: hypothetical protein H6617_09710 [Bdellovibrionaceae bacterium]|nr:hypothetical protein [Bdellovibrionales bacterium]MCB9254945.1 hypothetical protein [Pseudobdellovibrionaceae bacterium]
MKRNSSLLLLLVALSVLSACAPEAAAPRVGPFLVKLNPADHGKFDAIAGSKAEDKKKKQMRFLQERGHDLSWYPNTVGEIKAHDTVQILYFNYRDYVVGFCSGVFLSDGYIATAAHCSSAIYGLNKVGADCRDNVLFAYKAEKDGPLEYYACDRVVVYGDDTSAYDLRLNEANGPSERRWHSRDYMLYRLAELKPKAKLRKDADNGAQWIEKGNSLKTDDVLLALVVDPPAGASNLLSKYDVAVGEVQDGNALAKKHNLRPTDAIHFTALVNGLQSGNSGGPIYLLPNVGAKGSAARQPANWADWERIYTGPFRGIFPANIYVYSYPYQSLPPFFREAR